MKGCRFRGNDCHGSVIACPRSKDFDSDADAAHYPRDLGDGLGRHERPEAHGLAGKRRVAVRLIPLGLAAFAASFFIS